MKDEHKEHAIRIGKNILNLLIMNEKEQKDLAEYLGVGRAVRHSANKCKCVIVYGYLLILMCK